MNKSASDKQKGIRPQFDFGTNTIAISADGEYLAVGCDYGVDVLWKLNNLERIDLVGHRNKKDLFQDGTTNIHFSEDSRIFLTANNDASVNLWNTSGHVLAKLVGHTKSVKKAIWETMERQSLLKLTICR